MKKVLVTGCAGYIGSKLCVELSRQGYRVVGVDNFTWGNRERFAELAAEHDIEFYELDLCGDRFGFVLRHCIPAVDVIIPLAAMVGAPLCEKDPELAWHINHDVIRDMVQRSESHQRFIYFNTNSGYGQTDGTSEVNEHSPIRPISEYGLSKCAAETKVLKHGNSVVFRLATVFGVSPRMRFDLLVNDFTRRFILEGGMEIFEPHFYRNYVCIDDVIRAVIFSIENENVRGVYNLGYPEANFTKLELAELIHKTLCCKPPFEMMVQIGDGEDPDRRNYLVSNKKILGEGFRFKYGVEYGVRQLERYLQINSEVSGFRNY